MARERRDRAGFPPVRKSLGQHFLGDEEILRGIADAAQLTGVETVIEIGPGRGALTDILVDRCGELIAIEYDRALATQLEIRYVMQKHVRVVQADVLAVNFTELAGGKPYRLIGNVPYYITTPIIFQALEPPLPEIAVYLVQKEVADRLVAAPGTGEYGALSVNVAAMANVEILFGVPPTAFRPPPKVESAVVRITPRPTPLVPMDQAVAFRRLVQATFTMRRKQMQRILRSMGGIEASEANAILEGAGIDPMSRPETLTPEQFLRLLPPKT